MFNMIGRLCCLLSVAGTAAALVTTPTAAGATVLNRDEFSTTVDAGNGKVKTTLSSEPINFQTEAGSWHPIQPSLEESGGELRAKAVEGDISIPTSLGKPVELEHDGHPATFKLIGAAGSADVKGVNAAFDHAIPNVDVIYAARYNGVKETLVLRSPAAPTSFAYDLRANASWTAAVDAGDVILRDEEDRERYRIDAPLAWDSAADPAFSNALELTVSKVEPGRWRVTLRADVAWLSDTARVFPVSLDPNFSWSNGVTQFKGAQDCYLASGTQANNNFCAAAYLQTGQYNRAYKSLFKFDIASAIPPSANVTAATFNAFAPPATPKALASHSLRTLVSDWDSTATWNKRKGAVAWNTLGGDVSSDPVLTSSSANVQVNPGWYSWPAPLAAVRGWVDGSLPNYGFQLTADASAPSGNAYVWASTEASTTSQFPADSTKAPSLDVTWTPASVEPTLSVTGSFIDASANPISPDAELIANVAASSPADTIDRITVWIDGDQTFLNELSNADCTSACGSLSGALDMSLSSIEPGSHTATFTARDSQGRTKSQSVTFERGSEPAFETLVDDWQVDYAQAIDDSIAGLPPTPMPTPNDAVNAEGSCSGDPNSADCRAEAAGWASAMQAWLATADNPQSLPDLPRFPRPASDDPEALKAAATVDGMLLLAQRVARNPNSAQSVGVTWANPADSGEVKQWAVDHTIPAPSAVKGSEGPGGWKSHAQLAEVQPLGSTVDEFYRYAEHSAIGSVEAVEDELDQPSEAWEIPDDGELEQDLDDAEAYLALVQARGEAIRSVSTTITAATARTALAQMAANGADLTVVAPLTDDNGSTIEVPASPPTASTLGARTVGAPRGKTCTQAGDKGTIAQETREGINPTFWAPSRFSADSKLYDALYRRGLNTVKEHRLKARWTAVESLAWMCADKPKNRNVELEARVRPGAPRWSSAWSAGAEENEGHDTSFGSTNLPGEWHLDDIASGKKDDYDRDDSGLYPWDKTKYPDFSLVAERSRQLKYRALYQSNFTTNAGDTLEAQSKEAGGSVMYTAQATSWANGLKPEQGYCASKGWQYASCMFSKATVCYFARSIGAKPARQTVHWRTKLGSSEPNSGYNAHWTWNGPQATSPCIGKPDPRTVPNSNDNEERGGRKAITEPKLEGCASEGSTCVVDPGTWDPDVTLSYAEGSCEYEFCPEATATPHVTWSSRTVGQCEIKQAVVTVVATSPEGSTYTQLAGPEVEDCLSSTTCNGSPTHSRYPTQMLVNRGDLEDDTSRSNGQLWMYDADGTSGTLLTADEDIDVLGLADGTWSPDRRRVIRMKAGRVEASYPGEARHSVLADLTGQGWTWSSAPACSPDGTKVALTADEKLWVIDLATDQAHAVATVDVIEGTPSWSPTGTRLAFSRWYDLPAGSYTQGEARIAVVNTDGTNESIVTASGVQESSPRWAPDGLHIFALRANDYVPVGTWGDDFQAVMYTVGFPNSCKRFGQPTGTSVFDPIDLDPSGSYVAFTAAGPIDGISWSMPSNGIRRIGSSGAHGLLIEGGTPLVRLTSWGGTLEPNSAWVPPTGTAC